MKSIFLNFLTKHKTSLGPWGEKENLQIIQKKTDKVDCIKF